MDSTYLLFVSQFMFANSISVILLGLLIGLPALFFLVWSLKSGQFENLDEASEMIFDDEELRYPRPWENPEQVRERIERHGTPLAVRLQEWKQWL